MIVRTALAVALLTATATSAAAEQSVYLGFGADYGLPHSGEDQVFGSLIAGATFDLWEDVGFGLEGEVGEPIGGDSDRETSRLRGLFTYDFGPVTGIASLGIVQYEVGDTNFEGETVGLGAQMELSERIDGRFEIMRDFNDDDFGTNVTTSRVGVYFKF